MHVQEKLGVSERRACQVLGQPRSTQRYRVRLADDEAIVTAAIVALARQYGRHGYRTIRAMLRLLGWRVNRKRVERIWRREGLKVPRKQPKRGRLWLNDGSIARLRPCWKHHVWAHDFVQARSHDGKVFRMLTSDTWTERRQIRTRFHLIETPSNTTLGKSAAGIGAAAVVPERVKRWSAEFVSMLWPGPTGWWRRTR